MATGTDMGTSADLTAGDLGGGPGADLSGGPDLAGPTDLRGVPTFTITAAPPVLAGWCPPATIFVGRLVSSPAGLNCAIGGTCTAQFPAGSSVVVTGEPDDATTKFARWRTGPCANAAGPCTITGAAGATVSISADYAPQATLIVSSSSGKPANSVFVAPFSGLNCGFMGPACRQATAPTGCTAAYAPGTVVTVQATAGAGTRFTGWSDPKCPATSLTCQVTVVGQTGVAAYFSP